MKNLGDIRTGDSAAIVFINGGIGAQHRLAELGMLPGERLTMLYNPGCGAVTVCVKGSKLSIGHGLTKKIIVREE
ncbi:MAG: FeoA family protein [Candidatus Omnitrophota bacterium]